MARDPEPTEDFPPQSDGRTAWLAELRDALNRATALIVEARAAGRDTTEAEARIAAAFALLTEFETGPDATSAENRSAR